jgi:hypothetical protein
LTAGASKNRPGGDANISSFAAYASGATGIAGTYNNVTAAELWSRASGDLNASAGVIFADRRSG